MSFNKDENIEFDPLVVLDTFAINIVVIDVFWVGSDWDNVLELDA